MDGLWQDLRFAARILLKHRRFTAAAVSILALGIGGPTAVFSVVNAVMLRPVPYQAPSELVAITSVFQSANAPRRSPVVKLTDVAEWRTRSRTFASMGAFAYTQLPLRVGSQSFSPVTALMDAEFLPTLGNPLRAGTFFQAGPATDRTAIISHALWAEAFGSDPGAVGRTVAIDGAPFVVRGILAEGFQFPRSDASYFTKPVDLLMPASSFGGFPPDARQWFAIGRLAPGVTLARAESELQSVAEGLSRQADSTDVWSVRLAPLGDETTRRARQPLIVVLSISIVLLLIAATNLMNLFFSRGTERLKEMSIRRAVGSSLPRLVRQLLIESLLVAAAGGAFGLLLGSWLIRAVVALSPFHLPVSGAVSVDRTVLAFSIGVCAGASMLAGLFPALQLGRHAEESLHAPGLRTTAGRAVTRFQWGLCVFQIALGVALLAVSGLLAHSLWRMSAVNPGFSIDHVFGFNLSVPNDQSLADRKRFYAQALDEIRTIPGVDSAGLISFLPPETRAGVFMGVAIEGAPAPARGAAPRVANTLITSPDYFATLQMPLAGGRGLERTDTASSAPVIVVNETFARRYLPNGAIGHRIGTGFDGMQPVREIVGIVKDTHDRGLAAEPIATVYIAFEQFALPYGSIAIRARAPMSTIVPVIRDRLNRLNPSVPLSDFQGLDERIYASLREPRFYTLLAIMSASTAVFFVMFGLYGLISYSVSQRTPELGIRMALGAHSARLLRMVMLQGLRMSATGVVIGTLMAIASARALQSQLFQVQPIDPLTLGFAGATVVAATMVATYAPAYRASRLNPLTALRQD
jgi:putative ABC transport system permease protein